jgi:competence protein ComGC
MENFINSLPKPVLAILAIVVAIIVFMLIDPPHTVCDTQAETLKETLKGQLFTTEVQKHKIPPSIQRAKQACQLGNSAGSCYEYFTTLKNIAGEVGKASTSCTGQLYNIPEVRAALNDGIELMVRLAWGIKPPEPGLERFGWMQEAELAAFCRLRGIYIRANGDEAWNALRLSINAKLPGEEPVIPSDPSQSVIEPKKATLVMSEQEIWNRSLFSLRCETF